MTKALSDTSGRAPRITSLTLFQLHLLSGSGQRRNVRNDDELSSKHHLVSSFCSFDRLVTHNDIQGARQAAGGHLPALGDSKL
jgi:hypothetical protein